MTRTGPKTKASQGLKRYKVLNVTIPPELMDAIEELVKKTGQTKSAVVQELLRLAFLQKSKVTGE